MIQGTPVKIYNNFIILSLLGLITVTIHQSACTMQIPFDNAEEINRMSSEIDTLISQPLQRHISECFRTTQVIRIDEILAEVRPLLQEFPALLIEKQIARHLAQNAHELIQRGCNHQLREFYRAQKQSAEANKDFIMALCLFYNRNNTLPTLQQYVVSGPLLDEEFDIRAIVTACRRHKETNVLILDDVFKAELLPYIPSIIKLLESLRGRPIHQLIIQNEPNIINLPDEIQHMIELKELNIIDCFRLRSLPTTLKNMNTLNKLLSINLLGLTQESRTLLQELKDLSKTVIIHRG